jgi:hypothetical protein
MIDSSGRLFLDLVPINRRSCGSLKVLVIINTISKQDVNVIDSKDVFVNLVVINTISKDVNNVTITVIIIKKKSVSTAINASPSTSILPGRSPAINASPSTSILPGRSPTISTPSKKIGSASARLRFLIFLANNTDRQVHPNDLLHPLCQNIHLPPLDQNLILACDAIINLPVVEVKRRRDGGG